MITLEQLLQSREDRARHQQDLLGNNPGRSLVCLTVQLPGSRKRSPASLIIGEAGVQALRQVFPGPAPEVRDLPTGYEAYLPVPLPPAEAKLLCCGIEDSHPLGRLMDIDVITADGPLDRASVGLEPRRCLLCSNPARYCMRARTHSVEDLLERVQQMVSAYGQL